MQQYQKYPLPTAIARAIMRCPADMPSGEMLRIFRLIKDVELTEGHDEIISAITKHFGFPNAVKWADDVAEIVTYLEEQKTCVQ